MVDNYGVLKLRTADGTWTPVANGDRPLYVRMPDNTWTLFGNGGGPPLLKMRQSDNTWKQVSTGGLAGATIGSISGTLHYATSGPSIGRLVAMGVPNGDGSVTWISTKYTDENGHFAFINVPLDEPRVIVADEWHLDADYEVARQTVTVTPSDPAAVLDILMPERTSGYGYADFPYFLVHQRVGAKESGTSLDLYETVVGGTADPTPWVRGAFAPFPVVARSVSTSGLDDQETGYQAYAEAVIGWVSLPIAAMKADTLSRMSTLSDVEYPGAVFDHIDVIFRLDGHSGAADINLPLGETITNQALANYSAAIFAVGAQYAGTGSVVFLGATPTTNQQLWTFDLIDVPYGPGGPLPATVFVPVVRDKTLTKETGTVVWSDDLNQVFRGGTVQHVVQHTLPGTYPDEAAEYTIFTSDVPAAPPVTPHITPGYTIDNVLDVTITVNLVFRWGT